MFVDYYGISCCTYEVFDTRPVLVAPAGYPPEVLLRTGFLQLPDGRWGHYLNEGEYGFLIRKNQENPHQNVVFGVQNAPFPDAPAPEQESPEDRKKAVILCLCSIGCLLLGSAGAYAFAPNHLPFSAFSAFDLAALVLAVTARVKYPKNTFAKVLIRVYIILFVLMLIYVFTLIWFCSTMVESCGRECGR